ncbi:peptidase S41 [Flavobacterium jejuense]|uniref:Peptidase S41 n=1 Tax=Flavobacterium jejuense TaxID=1544455 RepID=A0ABX0IXQ7_9FLAO|nr:S41 family peptidase [Flavobacterium jejuense]NHN27537.1 peptidase S41 [Flavobacterium jejuense]
MKQRVPFKRNYFSVIKLITNKNLLLCFTILLIKCGSVSKHNASLLEPISPKELQKDVDYTYRKLQKMHPQLYLYIDKEQLDFKFDSLKKSIKTPLTSYEFYTKLSPVVAEIKQGHTFTYPNVKKYTKEEKKQLQKETGCFSQFKYEIFNDKLYIIENNSKVKAIQVGDEITQINSKPVDSILKAYKARITSDGYNTTFQDKMIARRFGTYYSYNKGVLDSVKLELNNEATFWIKRIKKDTIAATSKKDSKKLTKIEKDSLIKINKEKSKYGYNKATKKNNRTLTFIEKDSTTALLSIKGFTIGNFKRFYKETFELLKKAKTKNLIIDLRNNFGGRLTEIDDLYSYLTTDSTYQFVNPSQVTKRTSLLKNDYFKGSKPISYVVKGILSPIYYSYMFFKVRKNEKGGYYVNLNAKEKKAKENKFEGTVYVLINGGSFSASSILATKLKGTNRATFIGEETGGEYNGTVAGFMPKIELPHSKAQIRIGLLYVSALEKTTVKGHGIYPDVTIVPTIEDRINNNDPELNYVLDDIKKSQTEEVVKLE